MRQVSYVFPTSHLFRLPFHEALRERLAACDVAYRVIYSDPDETNRKKQDVGALDWFIKVDIKRMAGGRLRWQHAYNAVRDDDLVILQQESNLLINYPLQLRRSVGRAPKPKIAFFGHGRNFQSRNPGSLFERWKRYWATQVDWWFAYTDESRRHVASLGFPDTRITVFNNAVDTSRVRRHFAETDDARRQARRAELGLAGNNVAIFVGGLYEDKRLPFLISAAKRIRAEIADFELVVVGGGPAAPELDALTSGHDWIKVVGPRFGRDKVELMALAAVFLMPGLVGLAVVDAGATGLPTITTSFPWHSPEIAYLEDGVSGLIVNDWQSDEAYAAAITALLRDRPRLTSMQQAARDMVADLTIEGMADRVAAGVMSALDTPSYRGQ